MIALEKGANNRFMLGGLIMLMIFIFMVVPALKVISPNLIESLLASQSETFSSQITCSAFVMYVD